MKILIIAGSNPLYKRGNPIFLNLAIKMKRVLENNHSVSIAVDQWDQNLGSFTNKRKKKSRFLTFLSQYLMKVYEVIFLQFRYIKKFKLNNKNFYQYINMSSGVNSSIFKEMLQKEKFDIILCFGISLVKKETLKLSDYKFLNFHPGILPQYKGTGNFWAILNKDFDNVGISLHWMNEKIDDGKIISIVKVPFQYRSLWEMNILAFESGINEIERLLKENQLFTSELNSSQTPKYYGWYGLYEYFSFKRILKNKKYEI